MKKFTLNILKFTLFILIVYPLLVIVWSICISKNTLKPNIKLKESAAGHLASRLNELQTVENVDILFLGSSHTYRGFDNRVFSKHGYSSFNLGSSAQTPIQTNVLLNRHLKQLNPKLVVYEIYPGTFSIDGVESTLDLISNSTNDFNSFKMISSDFHIKTLNTFIFSTSKNAIRPRQFNEPIKKGKDTYIKGGYVEKEISYHKF